MTRNKSIYIFFICIIVCVPMRAIFLCNSGIRRVIAHVQWFCLLAQQDALSAQVFKNKLRFIIKNDPYNHVIPRYVFVYLTVWRKNIVV